jgi:hypothetical protein
VFLIGTIEKGENKMDKIKIVTPRREMMVCKGSAADNHRAAFQVTMLAIQAGGIVRAAMEDNTMSESDGRRILAMIDQLWDASSDATPLPPWQR